MSKNNENIEDRIKDIISDKLQNSAEFREDLDAEKMELIEKLFKLFPELKDKNKHIVIQDNKKETVTETTDENLVVLDVLNYDGKIYYKDKLGGIWDEQCDLVGIFGCQDKIIFFDEVLD